MADRLEDGVVCKAAWKEDKVKETFVKKLVIMEVDNCGMCPYFSFNEKYDQPE